MVFISKEAPKQTHDRLLKVVAQATIKVLDNSYAWREIPLESFPSEFSSESLAFVRDEEVWSQLVPSDDPDEELFKIFCFHFPSDVDNSGFVGWLATHLKRQFGTGVFVTCGQNLARGGIFDYLGCPLSLADVVNLELLKLVERGNQLLSQRQETPSPRALSLDGRKFNVTETAADGVVDSKTVFDFHQEGDLVWAEYAGGPIRKGCLVGTLKGNLLRFRYAQLQDNNTLDGGTSECSIEQADTGELKIVESFSWESRDGSGKNVFTEIV